MQRLLNDFEEDHVQKDNEEKLKIEFEIVRMETKINKFTKRIGCLLQQIEYRDQKIYEITKKTEKQLKANRKMKRKINELQYPEF